MSLSSQNILDIAEAVSGQIALATNVDYAIPSPFLFRKKEDFFAALDDDQDTKTKIETTLLRAAWLRYLTFEDEGDTDDNARDIEGPVRTLVYEITWFTESTFERLDQDDTPDDFNKQIRKTNHEHVTGIMSLCEQFQGVNSIPALAPSPFAVAETISLAQIDNTETDVECQFVPGVIGDQTKLECRIRVQLPC